MNNQKIIDALRKSRKYIHAVEGYLKTGGEDCNGILFDVEFEEHFSVWTDGNEIKIIDEALIELGIIV